MDKTEKPDPPGENSDFIVEFNVLLQFFSNNFFYCITNLYHQITKKNYRKTVRLKFISPGSKNRGEEGVKVQGTK